MAFFEALVTQNILQRVVSFVADGITPRRARHLVGLAAARPPDEAAGPCARATTTRPATANAAHTATLNWRISNPPNGPKTASAL